jgi:hypothetical protein
MGENADENGCGFPVASHRKPNVGKTYPKTNPNESDEFDSGVLGLQWQWNANYKPFWYFCNKAESVLRLFTVPSNNVKNLWFSPNLLLQRMPTDNFTVTVKMKFTPDKRFSGEKAGLVLLGSDYYSLYITKSENSHTINLAKCNNAPSGSIESIVEEYPAKEGMVYFFRMKIRDKSMVAFSYSSDNKEYKNIGSEYSIKKGMWVGAKIGLYANRPLSNNDGGWLDVDWFRIEI